MIDHPDPVEVMFRKAGKSKMAENYPLSIWGQAIVAEHNNVDIDQLPDTFRFASNLYMHMWLEDLGLLGSMMLPTRHESGRWLRPEEINIPQSLAEQLEARNEPHPD